jgi:hypothetical protein
MDYIEPNFEIRVKAAKELAQRILGGLAETEEEFLLSLRYVISEARSIPLFSEYFDARTMDELILETELIRAKSVIQNSPERTSSIINKDVKEREKLADLFEQDMLKLGTPVIEDMVNQADLDFMSTGEFKEP